MIHFYCSLILQIQPLELDNFKFCSIYLIWANKHKFFEIEEAKPLTRDTELILFHHFKLYRLIRCDQNFLLDDNISGNDLATEIIPRLEWQTFQRRHVLNKIYRNITDIGCKYLTLLSLLTLIHAIWSPKERQFLIK